MIPQYRKKRSTGDQDGNDFALSTLDRKDGANQINDNLTRNPQIKVLLTADTIVIRGGLLEGPDGLHPVIKYGIPIGAMFLLGFFIYATFSKRWNRRGAIAAISVESMKLNTTTSIDSIADYVSSQITSAESSVLRHIQENIGNTTEAIINDIPVANEDELISGLKKTIAQQELKMIDNIKKNFEQTKSSILIDARDKLTIVEETIEQILKNQSMNEDEGNKTEFVGTEDKKRELSEIQDEFSTIIQGRISNSPDALLPETEKQILHITDSLKNIMPKTLQESDQDRNRTKSRIESLEQSMIKEVKTIIVCAQENILEYMQNQINEVKQTSKIENIIKPRENYQNDMEVDIKQPGKISRSETFDTVQVDEKKTSNNVNIEKSEKKIESYSEKQDSIDGKIIVVEIPKTRIDQQDQKLCYRCAAATNNSEETNETLAIDINEKYDKMVEITLKKENDEATTEHVNLDQNRGVKNRGSTENIPAPKAKDSLEVNQEQILIIPEIDKLKKNYSVREQAEHSIKLWLARFKQAVPHIYDSFHSSEQLKNSNGQKTSKDKDIAQRYSRDHVTIDVDEMYNLIEHQDNAHTGQSEQSLIEDDKAHNQDRLNAESETIKVEIHQHTTENKQKESEERANTSINLLDIDNETLGVSGLKEVEERISGDPDATFTSENQRKQAQENAAKYELFKSEIEEKKKEMQREEKPDVSKTLLNTGDESFRPDGLKEEEENTPKNIGVTLYTEFQQGIEGQIYEHPHEYELKESDDKADFFEPLLNIDSKSTEVHAMKELERENGESTKNQPDKNAADYELSKSDIEQKKNEIILERNRSTNPVSDNTEISESGAEIPRKWLNIDEIIGDEKESWPSHLPRIIEPLAKENDLKETIGSNVAQGGEVEKNDILSGHLNDKEPNLVTQEKEWLRNENTQVKSGTPHEEIIKICGREAFDSYKQEAIDRDAENSEKVEITKPSEEMCQDHFAKLIDLTREENNLKEALEPDIPTAGTHYSQNREGNEAENNNIFEGDKIREENTEIPLQKTQEDKEQTQEERGDMQTEEMNASNKKEWLNNNKDVHKEKDNFQIDNNDGRKESIVSTTSDVSSSSNDSTSNETLQKEEERDSFPVLKLPNMDDKLRKKRKINRRQLKSLDSGVHHYYGEYIAIEFPINELDDQTKGFNGMKQSSSNSEAPPFIPSTSKVLGNEEDGISPIKIEDEDKL